MTAQGVPMRALHEMMGRDLKTTLIYAAYGARDAEWVEVAFRPETPTIVTVDA